METVNQASLYLYTLFIMLTTGIDIVEIERVERLLSRYGQRFLNRCFTAHEQSACSGRVISLASRFAVKEAVSKALGTGIGDVGWTEIEIRSDKRGKPELVLHDRARSLAERRGYHHWSISLSHTDSHAIGMVVGLGDRY